MRALSEPLGDQTPETVYALYGTYTFHATRAEIQLGLEVARESLRLNAGKSFRLNPMHHLRIARPVRDLSRSTNMYCRGLGLLVVGSFENHEGFDGVMLGAPGSEHHFEFTRCRTHPVEPAPTPEDLVVFYVPRQTEWQALCDSALTAGFKPVASFNPYWEAHGRTFEDADGYRVVLQCDEWRPEVSDS